MTTTTERLLADTRKLAPDITVRAAEIGSGRRVLLDLIETLKSIRAFRLFVENYGVLELDLPSALEVIGAPRRINGSAGWMATIANGNDLFAHMLPLEPYESRKKSSRPGGGDHLPPKADLFRLRQFGWKVPRAVIALHGPSCHRRMKAKLCLDSAGK
jgi:hypothetical protein